MRCTSSRAAARARRRQPAGGRQRARRSDISDWLTNPDYTPYAALAAGLLQLLALRPLARPVYIDVIRDYYEDILRAPSPRHAADIRLPTLKSAVLGASNKRYAAHAGSFDQLLKS